MRLHDRLRDTLAGLVVADAPNHDTTPARVSPLTQEWAGFFSRALDMAELDLAVLQGRVKLQPRRVGSGGRVATGVANARQRRICSAVFEGRPDAYVAYVEGCSEARVRRARAAGQLDTHGMRTDRSLTVSRIATEAGA